MRQHSLIRTIYLYLFTIVGLALLVVGSVRFIDMGLRAFIFTQADAPDKLQQTYIYYCPQAPMPILKLEAAQTSPDFTADEQQSIKSWLENYNKCQTDAAGINYTTSRRQKDAATNLALILVGLPLYLYHWLIIKKETKEQLVVNS